MKNKAINALIKMGMPADNRGFKYIVDAMVLFEDEEIRYRMSRASFEENDDMASWYAQCQQEPIERQGALFTSGDMKFYNPANLPEREPDRIFMAVDIAYGGGDYVAAPICYQYDDEYYITDVVFDDGDKFVTRPRMPSREQNTGGDTGQAVYLRNGWDFAEQRAKIDEPVTKRSETLLANACRCVLKQDVDGKIIIRANFATVLDPDDFSVDTNGVADWSDPENIFIGESRVFCKLLSACQ